MLDAPLVSVMITSYNQKDILPRAIDSVLNQTYNNIQIVIADDSSTDGSQDLINAYSEKFPGKIKPAFAIKNQGIPKNKNAGFYACDGELITYLDGDDYYFPEKIEKEIRVFQSNPNLDIVYSNFMFVDENGASITPWKKEDYCLPTGYIFEHVFSCKFPYKTLYRNELMKSEVLKRINYLDESLTAYEDWDSRIRMSKDHRVGYSDYIGSVYVDNSLGISKVTKRKRLIQNRRYVMEKNIHLLNDLPLYRRLKVRRAIEVIISKQEVPLSSHIFNLALAKYLMLSGDVKYPLKLIARQWITS